MLVDGETVHLRPIRPADAPRERAFLEGLTPATLYLRFHGAKKAVSDQEIEHFTNVDYEDRMALVAEQGDDIIAIGRYDRIPGSARSAEVAFVVADAHQGRGIGTLLLEHLAAVASSNGLEHFVAYVLPENTAMRRVFQDAGFESESTLEAGEVRFAIPLSLTDRTIAAFEAREQQARARSIARLLEPASVAVVGAGKHRGNVGHEIFRNVLFGEFQGPVYPVNPDATHVASVAAYPKVSAIPGAVDLAIIAVPTTVVAEVVRDCAAKGVNGLVVVSAGFAETGQEGAVLEREIASVALRNGMRMVGPNCLGVINTRSDIRLNATFAPDPPRPGRAGFMSQSGALGIAILDQADDLGIGISTFVSVGNKADVSGNDMLEFWDGDEDTDVVLLYLESFGNPRKFGRIARRVSRSKPIVAVKSGRSVAGRRAASSHTAAMTTTETAVDALFEEAGVIRVDTLEELFDVAQLLCHQPLPEGHRVGIVSNGGGPAILAADAFEGVGFEVPELTEHTQAELRGVLLPGAAVRNPVDLIAAAPAEHYEFTLRKVLADPNVDSVLVSYTPPLVTRADDVAEAVARGAAGAAKPIVANFLDTDALPVALGRIESTAGGLRSIPTYLFPESAARALARAAWYGEWRQRPAGEIPPLKAVEVAAARSVVAGALEDAQGRGWISQPDAYRLISCYGIPACETRSVASAREATEAAVELGCPVVLKAAAPDLVHKSDVGGVVLDLGTPAEVGSAYSEMSRRLGLQMGGAIVQQQVDKGVETIVGVIHDPSFGPLVMFGMGGVAAELLGDRAFRMLPLTDLDARALIEEIRTAPLLHGYRGAPPTDVDGLIDLLLRVGRLADDIPQLAEMDLNPVIVRPDGVTVVDVKVRVASLPEPPDLSLRRLEGRPPAQELG
ncbi:MAG: hypothetical protein JJLCMIEE_00520 [Acidimicrobiales bacterium]|nr:MAG: GNAT family N-acetyltransferase [Actinomycetota bacterium]MBV6507472.1 hypothetical protein [Acidimicrobiales bacterium]RIK07850.1 MAG: hypothetical protein DCC48_02550 [Acidobacteriota bacterium]